MAGLVIRDLAPRPSNYRATTSLPDGDGPQGVVGIADVDTRALTRHLRSAGAMRCGIFSGAGARRARPACSATVRSSPGDGRRRSDRRGHHPDRVHRADATGERRFTVAAFDLGIKTNTPRMLAARGITTHVLPATATVDEIVALGVDGVFLSNGPGDPATADGMVELTRELLARRIPLFGICFGNQILGRALGFGTYKLKFGHRGINQPVRDERTGRVLISAHNHGFAVDAPVGEVLDTPFGPGQGQLHLPERRRRRGAGMP